LSGPSDTLHVDRFGELCFSAGEKSCEVAYILDKCLDSKIKKMGGETRY
jgi:hypothetical protein